jgi:hypothetical protein
VVPYQPPPPAAPDAGGVYVEIRTTSPNVRIDRMMGDYAVPVCFAPCRQVLPRNSLYVVTGDGVRQTSRFMLPDGRAQLLLDVDAGSSARATGGAVLAGIGGVAAYIALLAVQTAQNVTFSNGTVTTNQPDNTVQAVVIVSGLAAVAAGVYMVLTARTTVTTSSGVTFTDVAPPRPARRRPALALTARGLEF